MPPKKDVDYKITPAPNLTKEQEKQEALEIPAYMTQLDLDDDNKARLSKEFFKEYDVINEEWRSPINYRSRFKGYDNQYEGNLEKNVEMQFNLHKPTTKIKVDAVSRALIKAFLQSNPLFSISARPEFAKEGGNQITEQQSDYLDYKLDEGEIPFKAPMSKVFHSAAGKGVGVLKLTYEIRREKRSREEIYVGDPVYLVQIPNPEPGGQPLAQKMDQETFDKYTKNNPDVKGNVQIISNKGLEDFISSYPDAPETYPGLVKQLVEGKEIRIVVDFEEVTYNDPLLKYVEAQNFFCRLSVEGYEGLKNTKLHGERENFTWWELKQEEKKGKFYNIDELKFKRNEDGSKKVGSNGEGVDKNNYENEDFDILEALFYFKIKETDEEETKIVVWIEEESKTVIGAIKYPYYGVDSYYFPFFILQKRPGFLQPGLCEYLKDSNIAENFFLNHTLEAVYMRNMITPITPEGSDADIQFLDQEFKHGIPINAKVGEIDFLQKYMQQIDVGGLVAMMNILTRNADDVTRVSSLTTGAESQIDPEAPARKTLALLKQSGINIEEYIENILPTFNQVAQAMLQLTYQHTKEGRKYTKKGKDKKLFNEIPRAAMIARTNIQSQAAAFNFDKLSEKQEDLALRQILREEPLIARNPQAVYIMLKNIIKGWSPKWRNMVDEILPSPEEFQKQQLTVAVQAMATYIKVKAEESKTTGKPLEFKLEEVMKMIAQATQEMATFPSDEEMREREKAQEKNERPVSA